MARSRPIDQLATAGNVSLGGLLRRLAGAALLPLCLGAAACRGDGEDAVLTLALGGDVMLDRGVRRTIERQGVEALLAGVAPVLARADFAVINLECPVTDEPHPREAEFVFRAEPDWLPVLRRAGVTHAGLANNHALDQGAEGLAATVHHLRESGIVPVGAGAGRDEACLPAVVSRHGVECALLNASLVGPEGEDVGPADTVPCQASPDELVSRVAAHRAAHPERRIVAFLHWGAEYAPVHQPEQRRLAHRLIDAGADAVIGHHPHVVQPVEEYRGRPICYSLGNLVFDQPQPWCREGLVVLLRLRREGSVEVEICPVRLEDNAPRRADAAEEQVEPPLTPAADRRWAEPAGAR